MSGSGVAVRPGSSRPEQPPTRRKSAGIRYSVPASAARCGSGDRPLTARTRKVNRGRASSSRMTGIAPADADESQSGRVASGGGAGVSRRPGSIAAWRTIGREIPIDHVAGTDETARGQDSRGRVVAGGSGGQGHGIPQAERRREDGYRIVTLLPRALTCAVVGSRARAWAGRRAASLPGLRAPWGLPDIGRGRPAGGVPAQARARRPFTYLSPVGVCIGAHLAQSARRWLSALAGSHALLWVEPCAGGGSL